MIRTVKCGFENGNLVPEENCSKIEKPIYETECENKFECVKHSALTSSTQRSNMYRAIEKWSKVNLYTYFRDFLCALN